MGIGKEGDTDSSRSTVTTRENPDQVALLPLLDIDAATKAVGFILATWPNAAPMTAAQREAWMDVLTLMHPGELKRALAARTDDKSHRPEPYAILEVVNHLRAQDARIAREYKERQEREQRRADATAPVTPTALSAAQDVFDQWRHLRRPGKRR